MFLLFLTSLSRHKKDTQASYQQLRSCFEFLQKVFLGLMYPFSCVLWAIFWSFSLRALGDFLVLFAPVLRQIARYIPHHRSENASKTHPKSAHDKFKTASNKKRRPRCNHYNQDGFKQMFIKANYQKRTIISTTNLSCSDSNANELSS